MHVRRRLSRFRRGAGEVGQNCLDTSPDLYEPDRLIPLADTYGAKVDFEGTMPIVERHRLNF